MFQRSWLCLENPETMFLRSWFCSGELLTKCWITGLVFRKPWNRNYILIALTIFRRPWLCSGCHDCASQALTLFRGLWQCSKGPNRFLKTHCISEILTVPEFLTMFQWHLLCLRDHDCVLESLKLCSGAMNVFRGTLYCVPRALSVFWSLYCVSETLTVSPKA